MLAVIRQDKIDAPAFPRDQAWWGRFVPSYITADVRDDGTVALGITGVAHPSQPPKPAAEIRRNQEMAFMRWLGGLPRLEAGVIEADGEPCQCWRVRSCVPHGGHCCLRGAVICHQVPAACPRGEAADQAALDDETCTTLACTECAAPAGQPCEIWCIADQAVPAG